MATKQCSYHIEKEAYPQAPYVLWRRQCKRMVKTDDERATVYCHDHRPRTPVSDTQEDR